MAPKPQEQIRADPVPARDGERVVISGISGLYPKSHNVKEFNEILYNKVNPITEENKRWKSNHPEVARYTGTAPGLDRFDAQFFKVHFRLGTSMDAMSKKILEQTYQAIYDAGRSPEDLNGKKVAVFIGACFSEAEKASFYVASTRTGFGIVGCSKSMFANRISYWLNAKGPSISIDEACCSSSASLALAYQALARGDCEAAIVGGANLYLHPQSSIHTGRIITNCPDGKTKSFDENADGCAKSEAIQVVFLQRAKDALRVYAEVLKVKNEYMTRPSGETEPKYGFYRDPVVMANYLRKFYEDVNVPPEAVEYVEANGSAMPDADKSELESIGEVFCKGRTNPLLVGSVFSNIGYTEASSGLCAVVKVLLAYQRGEIAANLHCSNPRKDIPALQDGTMRIVTEHEPFHRSYVAINNHSITGCSAHILLHGHYKPKDLSRYQSSIPRLVTISARQESAVKKILDDLKSRPIDAEELALLHNIHCKNISGHLGRGFTILDTNAENQTVSLVEKCEYFDNARRPLWFVYSGMGSQWAGMGTQLMRIPVFAAAIERCHRALQPKGVDLIHIITSTDKTIFDNILHSFVGIAAVQIGLTDVLNELGLIPDKIIGHSVGELGCAYADGCFTAEQMILSAYSRGLVSVQTPFIRGSMAAVGIGYEKIKDMIPPEIEVACHNSGESSTISGPADVMKEFVATLTAKGIFAKEVPCSNIAYHSRYIAEAGPGLLKYLSEVIKNPKPRSERWVSTSVPRDRWDEPIAKLSSAEYHTNNLLNPVLFEETSSLIPSNAVLVEIAPHGLLQAILKRSLPASCKHIPLTRRGHPDNALMVLEGIGKLFMEGYNPIVKAIYPKVEFPVSTGTPMLSHLVEWAHNETWLLPLYVAAHRKIAAAANYIVSLHDPENSYLRGNVIKGKNVYPFATALVAVWDTLSMLYNKPKKQASVMFYDLQFYVQPLLNDRRPLKISVGMHRGTFRFEVLDGDSEVVNGFAKLVEDEMVFRDSEFNKDITISSDDVYQMLLDREYSYSDDFRGIQGVDSSLTEALLLWNNNYVTMIDSMIQLNVLRHKHDSVSQPIKLRKLCIDPDQHLKTTLVEADGKVAMRANINQTYGETRCGGIFMESISFNDLPLSNSEKAVINTLKFIPRFNSSPLNVKTTMTVFLQMVAENLNKDTLNVVEVINSTGANTVFTAVKDIDNILGVKVNFRQIHRAIPPYQEVLCNTDLVLIQNLSMEDDLCKLLYSVLRNNVFVLSAEEISHESLRVRPSSLYRVVGSQNLGGVWLHLLKWRPVALSASTMALTVRTHSDISLLTSTRNCLPPNHKLIVLTSYPGVDGVKELVQLWRKDSEQNDISLVMVSHDLKTDESLVEVPELDLAINVLDKGVWGGEYFVPVDTKSLKTPFVTLQSKQIGDLNSLTWVEASEPTTPGTAVTVHFAGLNTVDSKRATGVYSVKPEKNGYGIDFSGVTDSGVKVMGLVPNGAAGSRVHVAPELLWPVPKHWTMEDAATVPMPYAHAFYCLAIKVRMLKNTSILVHGGTGALGQAVISIALAHGLRVFTTVSDLRKKHFLRKLFPELKEDHIGNSRDPSFGDMILTLTKGVGVTYVINCVKGELKNVSMKCTSPSGAVLDTIQIPSEEAYNFGMYNLGYERCYMRVNFASIFDSKVDMIKLQWLISEGITRGFVRPLSRVTYDSTEVSRAFRLLETSQHRGRVLLKLNDSATAAQPRIFCSQSLTSVIISDDDSLGMQLAGRLVKRGARKLLIHQTGISSYVLCKTQFWEQKGVEVKLSTDNLSSEKHVTSLLSGANKVGPVEGIYFVNTGRNSDKEEILRALDVKSRKLGTTLKYFAVISTNMTFGNQVCFSRAQSNLPATKLYMPFMKTVKDKRDSVNVVNVHTACDALEYGLRSRQPIVTVQLDKAPAKPLLQKIASIAGVKIPEDVKESTILEEIGVNNEKVQGIAVLLRDEYNQSFSDEHILDLTIKDVQEIDKTLQGAEYKETKGLELFYSNFDSDELCSTTEIMVIPTMVNSSFIREDEFDMSQTYLCILPGLEGHYERFRELCERVKVPALVLQPGLDIPNESIKQMAARFAQILIKKVSIKNNFYLLGYESGILVALEIAAILEEHGLTGTIYCIGSAPEQFKTTLESELQEFKTDEELQNGIIRHMYKLITGDELTVELDENKELKERVSPCVRDLLSKVALSAQYARAHLEVPYYRVQQARQYTCNLKPLQSKLVLFRTQHLNEQADEKYLQKYSLKPLEVHDLLLPFTYALQDQRCSAYINQHLDKEILEAFDKKNLCDTYLLSSECFMTLNDINSTSN